MNRNIFQGRYGIDKLSVVIMAFSVFCFYFRGLWILGILLAALVLFRAFSRNVSKRQRELWAFNGVLMKISAFFRKYFGFIGRFNKRVRKRASTARYQWQHRKENVFPRCPKCRNILRLPRGRGTLLVTCPVCGHEFKKKT